MAEGANMKLRFTGLVQPLLDSLYRTAFRMVEDRLTAEELVQEACLKAYARIDRFQEGTNFKAWLFRILTNLCIDHLRKRAGVTFLPLETVAEPTGTTILQADGRTPEAVAIGRSVEGAVARALSAMAPELRVVVMLVLVEEMTYAEAAQSLDLPVGTVRSRLHRARAELKRRLGPVIGGRPPRGKGRDVSRIVMLFA
ncbi:MAG: sigma-70 family RNA polymerase sigma factor [Pseudomonadota bacterium]